MRLILSRTLFIFILCGLVSPALAATSAVLYGPELEARQVYVTGLTEETLTYFDEHRELRSESATELVRLSFNHGSSDKKGDILPANDRQAATQADAWLAMTDGQVLVGRLLELASDGQSFIWQHPTLGRFEVDLQGVAALHLDPQPLVLQEFTSDLVLLRNGDRLRGFVSGLGPEGLQIVPAGAAEPVTLATDRWQWVRLGNEPIETTHEPYRVTLIDGSRVLAQSVALRQDTVYLGLTGQLPTQPPTQVPARSLELPLEQVAEIDFHLSGWRLRELERVPMRVISGGEVFGVPWPQAFEATPQGPILRLHAPVTVAFDLPRGTRQVAFDATLDDHQTDPYLLNLWADMRLQAGPRHGAQSQVEPISHHFDAQSPHASFNLPVSGEQLVLQLSPGDRGPVLARLRIENALLLTREPEQHPRER